MKSLLIKIVIYCSILIGAYAFFVDKLAHGFVDPNYNKFTQKAGGLILGLSRANQGISPFILEEKFNKEALNFKKPLINFAFNDAHFGEVYLNAIKQKLSHNKDGIFILSISPGNFTAPLNFNDEDIYLFDKQMAFGKISNYNANPNYDYILNNYGAPLYNTLHDYDEWPHNVSHENGWNEIIIATENDTIQESDMTNWTNLTMRFYKRKAKAQALSKYRYNHFIKTIEYLKTNGKVVLVRIPPDPNFLDFENEYWSDFNKEMDSISKIYNIPFFNYTTKDSPYKTYDGSHLESKSAAIFSKVVANDIIEHYK